jgi:hypothetical protein
MNWELVGPAGPARLRFRLWLVQLVAATVLAASWVGTLGPVPAVVAAFAAKDVLVALLLAGLAEGHAPLQT